MPVNIERKDALPSGEVVDGELLRVRERGQVESVQVSSYAKAGDRSAATANASRFALTVFKPGYYRAKHSANQYEFAGNFSEAYKDSIDEDARAFKEVPKRENRIEKRK